MKVNQSYCLSRKIGDDVLFFGQNSNGHIPIETIANSIKSTTYVLLTAIGGRTRHIYIRN